MLWRFDSGYSYAIHLAIHSQHIVLIPYMILCSRSNIINSRKIETKCVRMQRTRTCCLLFSLEFEFLIIYGHALHKRALTVQSEKAISLGGNKRWLFLHVQCRKARFVRSSGVYIKAVLFLKCRIYIPF